MNDELALTSSGLGVLLRGLLGVGDGDRDRLRGGADAGERGGCGDLERDLARGFFVFFLLSLVSSPSPIMSTSSLSSLTDRRGRTRLGEEAAARTHSKPSRVRR